MNTKIILLLISIFFTSCRELVQDDFPALEPVPVVYSILEEGEPLRVFLTWTASLDTSRLQVIDNATVQLYTDGQYAETLAYDGNGFYSAATVVAPSVRYQCVADVPGKQTVTAIDSLPTAIVPTGVQYIPIAGRNEEGRAYPAIRFTITNNPGEKRYYEAKIWGMRSTSNPTIDPETGGKVWVKGYEKKSIQSGPVTDPVLQSEGLSINIFSNEKIHDDSYTMTVNLFISSYSNSDGKTWNPDTYPTILELRAVSYHYYCYMKQRYLYEQGFEPEFGKTSPPTNLYSNVDNGYGIFAGYSASMSDTMNLK